MRIAFLTPLWPPTMAQNGIATYVDVMARALERKGHECVVITMWSLGEVDDPRMIEVHTPPMTTAQKWMRKLRHKIEPGQSFDYNLFGPGVANALIKADQEKPVDIIEAEESFGLARYCVGKTGAAVVVRSHGPHFLVHQQAFHWNDRRRVREEGRAYREADAVSFPSAALRDGVASHYGMSFPVSGLSPNPIDIVPATDAWTLDGCEKETILFVGRFDAVKGSDIALKAFELVVQTRPGVRLVIAGVDQGIRNSEGVLLKFDDYARAHLPEEVRSRIEFLGPVPRSEIPNLRRRALINLTSSRYETFPYAVTEALAIGAPTVATATPGLAEYLKDGEEILFAQVGDAEKLASQMGRCLDNPEFAASLGAKGRESAIRLFSPDVIADSAEAFYEQVIKGARPAKAAAS